MTQFIDAHTRQRVSMGLKQVNESFDSNESYATTNHDTLGIPQGLLRDHSRYGPNQWETTLQCNVVSHWLSPNPEGFQITCDKSLISNTIMHVSNAYELYCPCIQHVRLLNNRFWYRIFYWWVRRLQQWKCVYLPALHYVVCYHVCHQFPYIAITS